jgi:hypothetical protein
MAERINATIQAEVPERCVAIGALQPAGTWDALYNVGQRQLNKKAGALTDRTLVRPNHITYVALTADKLYAFDTKPRRTNMKVIGKLAEWDRKDVRCQLIPGKAATTVVIDHADGGHYELETMSSNEEFLAALADLP